MTFHLRTVYMVNRNDDFSLFSDWPVCGFLCVALHSAEVQLGWTMYLFCSMLLCILVCVILRYLLSGVLDVLFSCGGMQ